MELLEPAENFVRMYKLFIKKSKLKCFDFGIGDGRHVEFLLCRGNRVIGSDISKEALNLTKKRLSKINKINLKNLNLIFFSNENYIDKFIFNKIDLIVCWETLHWLGDFYKIQKMIENFTNSLKKGGKIFITFPAEDHYLLNKKNIKNNYNYKINLRHRKNMIICAPPIQILKQIFSKNKLKTLGIFKYSHRRDIFTKIKNDLKSSAKNKNLFSMYGFVLQK